LYVVAVVVSMHGVSSSQSMVDVNVSCVIQIPGE
jgi:hypothetical protein